MPNRDAQKAALLAAVSAGASLRAACRDLGIPRITGQRWWAAYRPVAGGAADGPDGPQTQTGPSYEERLHELLDASLRSMLAQVRQLGQPAWMEAQNARDLGVAYGIVVDKAARIAGLIEQSRAAAAGAGADLDGPAEAGPLAGGD